MKSTALTMLILLLAWFEPATAEIVFVGDSPANRREIERLGPAVPVDSIKGLLANEGYLDAAVGVDSNRVRVEAGPRYVLTQVEWRADTIVIDSTDVPFTRSSVERLIEDKLYSYRQEGYLYTTAHIEAVVQGENEVTLRVRLNPGPRIRLGRIILSGLTRTRADIVERYLPLQADDLLTEKNLAAAERAAAAIPFIDFRGPAIIKPKPGYGAADLEFQFVEKKQLRFSGGGGYIPDAPTRFVWNVNLDFENLFGAGRRIRLQSERREQDRQILNISFAQPLFLIGLGEAELSVATRDYREQFYEFALGAAYRARFGGDFSAGLAFGWRSIEPADNSPSYSSFTTAFSIARDNIDDALNPSRGLAVGWTIAYSYRSYSDDTVAVGPERSVFNETRNTVSIDWYRPLVGDLISRLKLTYTGLETNQSLPPVSELFYIGGPGSLRGFRNEQFVAVRSAFGSVEPRLRFEGGNLFIFYDAAYINNRVTDSDGSVGTDEIYRYGFGFGAAVIDGPRSVKLSLAWNPDISFDQPRLSVEFLAEI